MLQLALSQKSLCFSLFAKLLVTLLGHCAWYLLSLLLLFLYKASPSASSSSSNAGESTLSTSMNPPLTVPSPISDYWKLTFDPQPNCISQPLNLLAAGIVNTFTDFVVVLLPIPTVLKLKLPRRQQIIVITLFTAGFVVCIAGCARTYYTFAVSLTYDQTWAGWSVWLTGAIELYVAVVCVSAPSHLYVSTNKPHSFARAYQLSNPCSPNISPTSWVSPSQAIPNPMEQVLPELQTAINRGISKIPTTQRLQRQCSLQLSLHSHLAHGRLLRTPMGAGAPENSLSPSPLLSVVR